MLFRSDGEWGDAWIYEDQVIYVQKKFVAIPLSATTGDDPSTFDKTAMTMTAVTYDDMRPGCYDAKARLADLDEDVAHGALHRLGIGSLVHPVERRAVAAGEQVESAAQLPHDPPQPSSPQWQPDSGDSMT